MAQSHLAVLVLSLSAFATGAQAANLKGDEISALIGGKRVFLATPYGLEFPLYYRANGQVSGDASGFTMASMFAPKETGSWWVKGDQLCQKWPSWYKGRTICFTIQKTGADTIAWVRDDGTKGTARITD